MQEINTSTDTIYEIYYASLLGEGEYIEAEVGHMYLKIWEHVQEKYKNVVSYDQLLHFGLNRVYIVQFNLYSKTKNISYRFL